MKVLIDTREKKPWQFHHPDVSSAEIQRLETGDYSVAGLEDMLCIERKKVVAEFATCVTAKRFKNELDRMLDYKYRYLIFEFTEGDVLRYPEGSNIPRVRWPKLRVRGTFIMKFIEDIQRDYELNVIFAGDATNAELKTIEIMKTIYDNEQLSTFT